MATMTSIRERQKFILWAFLVIFLLSLSIGGLVGGANIIDQIFGSNLAGNAVGVVNSNRITLDQLSQAISAQTAQAREQFGELNDRLVDQAENQAWESLVNLFLLNDEIADRRLEVSGDEIYYLLENYPPQFLQQHEAFQTEGEFDPNLYYQALNNPTGNEWAPVETYLINILPSDKMSNLVRAIAYTSEEEVKSAWYERNTEATIDYIYVPSSRIKADDIVVSEDDLKTIYRRNRDSYTLPETRILEYVYWEKIPTAEDSAEVEETARQLAERARAGEDFAQLALDYSEDPGSGPGGGDLGWFGKGQMVTPFEEAAFSARVGEIVSPVKTQFGYHVIKIEDRREDEDGLKVSARHILLKVVISSQTYNRLRSQANIFSADAADSSFEIALKNHGLASRTSTPLRIADKYLPPPVGMLRRAVRFAFEAEEVDLVSDVVENEQCYLVARLAEVRPEGVQSFEEVRESLEPTARQEAANEQATLIMASIQQQLAAGIQWPTVADSFPEATYAAGTTARLNGSFSGIGRSPLLTGLLKTLVPGQVSEVIRLERGEAIVRLVDRTEPDWEQYADNRESQHEQLLNRRINSIWNDWLADLKKQARIIDNRHVFY
ncbi:MAG: peptidylprolyl isomerase [Fidelibacterota bacterium]|nr:MAG: peptidylprolyl isomerase [Candidatus Neomarinimicrobiota bacterium]